MAKCPHMFAIPRPHGGGTRIRIKRFDNSIIEMTGMLVPCGKCLICRQQRAREWAQRLKHEMYFHERMCFITLTYNDEYVPVIQGEYTLWKNDLQLFWKRLRKRTQEKIKYLACGEYGDRTSRPHYHAIIFGWRPNDARRIAKDMCSSLELEQVWGFGQVSVGGVGDESVHYVTGYVLKKLPEKARGTRQMEFICASQGMGLRYAEMYEEEIQKGELLTDGKDKGIPVYYRRKIKERLPDNEQWNMEKCIMKRRVQKDIALEKELRSRSGDIDYLVELAQRQNELDLQAKLKRQGKSNTL